MNHVLFFYVYLINIKKVMTFWKWKLQLWVTHFPMFYSITKGPNLAINYDIRTGITFLISITYQTCRYHYKGIAMLFPLVAVLLNVFDTRLQDSSQIQ